ncbi:MAG TPA: TetR family transcriptional regulator [Burkholderiales bacterium]|nr:TetR family transcriptional regulator [Burkholderiales bacterium]
MKQRNAKPTRGDATRANILAVARQRFAAEGYERATIRAIAADAQIDPALVMRYYGNKEGLFAAAAEFDLRLPDLTALPRRKIGAALVDHFLARWEEDDVMKALLRAATTNDIAAERLRAIFARQVVPAIARLCRDPAEAPSRAGLVSSQFLGFALTRYLLKLPPVASMKRTAAIKWLAPTVQHYVCGERPA